MWQSVSHFCPTGALCFGGYCVRLTRAGWLRWPSLVFRLMPNSRCVWVKRMVDNHNQPIFFSTYRRLRVRAEPKPLQITSPLSDDGWWKSSSLLGMQNRRTKKLSTECEWLPPQRKLCDVRSRLTNFTWQAHRGLREKITHAHNIQSILSWSSPFQTLVPNHTLITTVKTECWSWLKSWSFLAH